MNKFFVYYNYPHYEAFCFNGGVGFQGFPTKAEALAFINKLHKLSPENKITDWTLIEGRELTLRAVQRVTEITT